LQQTRHGSWLSTRTSKTIYVVVGCRSFAWLSLPARRIPVTSRRAAIGLPPIEAELTFLAHGEVIPFGPDRPDHPLFRWPREPSTLT
jgi:hypothetical protein